MGEGVTLSTGRFRPGDRVRVSADDRSGHVRTPFYVRGKRGRVERVYGEFRNPESLAYGGDGLPKRALYRVVFDSREVWDDYDGGANDKVSADIFEHWLDPA
jgi:nitrile hydratase